ncbi:MAG: type II secretion system protein [Sedimentisphaerales bacterium]
MKSIVKQNKKAAFTIVELLTVMSIIVILIGLLVPALNQVRKYAKDVKQKAQFHAISVALEFFNGEFETYPDSSRYDHDQVPYCGAMKLGEAMVGKDFLGFNPDSVFNSSGEDYSGRQLYDASGDLSARKTYLDLENANAYRIQDIYSNYSSAGFSGTSVVLCDVFGQVTNKNTGLRMGMPILYYKAHPAKLLHSVDAPENSIYNFWDNQDLLMLGKPWDTSGTETHRLATEGSKPGARFYENTRNDQISVPKPFNKDTYLLISAGNDGEYGTSDDICNFDFTYRELP